MFQIPSDTKLLKDNFLAKNFRLNCRINHHFDGLLCGSTNSSAHISFANDWSWFTFHKDSSICLFHFVKSDFCSEHFLFFIASKQKKFVTYLIVINLWVFVPSILSDRQPNFSID